MVFAHLPVAEERAETLLQKASRSNKRRNIVILALCGSFAVIPLLSLLHRPSNTIVVTDASADSPAGRSSAGRTSPTDGRSQASTTMAEPVSAPTVSSTQPTVTIPSPAVTTTVTSPPVVAHSAAKAVSAASVHAAATTTTAAPHPVAAPKVAQTTLPPHVVAAPPPSVTTTTVAPAPAATHLEVGAATWLATIPTGTCADNGAPMGSTIRVTTAAGASITCRVVSRGPFAVGRIVDVAKATFALLAPTSQGVVNVRVTW